MMSHRRANGLLLASILLLAACARSGLPAPTAHLVGSPTRDALPASTLGSATGLTPFIALSPTPGIASALVPSSTPGPSSISSSTPTFTLPAPISSVGISPENAAALTQTFEIRFDPWELVMAVAWSPEGERLAVSAGENVYLYSTSDWGLLATMSVGAFTHSLAFSPDSAWLAAGSRDGFLRTWWLGPGQELPAGEIQPALEIQAHKKGVNSVAFSPDGRLLASGGNDAVARFWNLSSGELLGQVVGGTFAVPSIAFTPDSAALAVVNGDVIRLREVGTERIIGTLLAESPLYSVALSPDGRLLAAGDINNLIRLWDPEQAYKTGQEEYPQPLALAGHAGKADTYRTLIWQLAFSPDGRLLASAGGDATLRLWDVASARHLVTPNGHTAGVTCVAFHPLGFSLVSGGLDGVLRVWEVGK